MRNKLDWAQILDQYKDEWVELIDYKWDMAEPSPSEGVVRTHSSNRKEFNRLISEDPADDSAVVFAGKVELPENTYLHANLRIAQR